MGSQIKVKSGKFPLSSRLFLKFEKLRLRIHFRRVLALLKSRDTNHLSPKIQKKRNENIEILKKYAKAGTFPINTDVKGRKPHFVDRFGMLCAVADILEKGNQNALIDYVVEHDNNIRIKDLNDRSFLLWAEKSGLTIDELERIQPTYNHPQSINYLVLTLQIAGLIAIPFIVIGTYKFFVAIRKGKNSIKSHNS